MKISSSGVRYNCVHKKQPEKKKKKKKKKKKMIIFYKNCLT